MFKVNNDTKIKQTEVLIFIIKSLPRWAQTSNFNPKFEKYQIKNKLLKMAISLPKLF